MADDPRDLREPLRSAVLDLIDASDDRVQLVSGCRSRAEQERLYADYRAGRGPTAARPGNSRHETCRAADLGPDAMRPWIEQNAPRFGLVRTVPDEWWHWEHKADAGNRAITQATGGGGAGGGGGTVDVDIVDAPASARLLSEPATWRRVLLAVAGVLLLAGAIWLAVTDLGFDVVGKVIPGG